MGFWQRAFPSDARSRAHVRGRRRRDLHVVRARAVPRPRGRRRARDAVRIEREEAVARLRPRRVWRRVAAAQRVPVAVVLVAVGLDPATVVYLELEPGDLALWTLLTVHGSLPNESAHDRAFAISSYVRAETSRRGEWAFLDGVAQPLGDTPQVCKDERLHERLEPHYDPTPWYL